MSLFQCKSCGCIENTACAGRGWEGKPSNCSACEAPTMALPGRPEEWKKGIPKWHGKFERVYLPKGQYITNPNTGDLVHKFSGKKARVEDERKTEWCSQIVPEDNMHLPVRQGDYEVVRADADGLGIWKCKVCGEEIEFV